MAGTGTTRDRVWGSVTNERDEVFMATVALPGKLAANLLRDDHGVPQTNNLKLDVAAHVLKRRHQGRETYSPTGENSI